MEPTTQYIANGDTLFRRVLRSYIRANGSISPAAYQHSNIPLDDISVDLARLTTPERSLSFARNPERWTIGAIEAAIPRSLGFEVVHTPTAENDAHASIRGSNTIELCDMLAKQTLIVFRPNVSTE